MYIKILDKDFPFADNRDEQREKTENSRSYDPCKHNGEDICWCCGKKIKDFDPFGRTHMIHAIDNFDAYTEDADETETGKDGDCGWFPVGPSCYRKIKKAFAEHGIVVDNKK